LTGLSDGVECLRVLNKQALFSLCYFAPISWYIQFLKAEKAVIEAHENFIKQSFRNRAHIAGPQGLQKLIIPVKWKNHTPYQDVVLADDFKWRREHLRSLQTAYKNAAFFEHYEHNFIALFESPINNLFEFNLQAHELIMKLLKLEQSIILTSSYESDPAAQDFRSMVHPKTSSNFNFVSYPQVFQEKNGQIPDLSILDLTFNLGLEAALYLKGNL